MEASFQSPAQIDEDAGFFASITPFVKKFNDDQKISFRMGVLTLIQQMKAQNPVMSKPPSTSSSASSYSIQPGPSNNEIPHYTYQPNFENLWKNF